MSWSSLGAQCGRKGKGMKHKNPRRHFLFITTKNCIPRCTNQIWEGVDHGCIRHSFRWSIKEFFLLKCYPRWYLLLYDFHSWGFLCYLREENAEGYHKSRCKSVQCKISWGERMKQPKKWSGLAKGQLLQNQEPRGLNGWGFCMHQKPSARLADLCGWEGSDEPSLLSLLITL